MNEYIRKISQEQSAENLRKEDIRGLGEVMRQNREGMYIVLR